MPRKPQPRKRGTMTYEAPKWRFAELLVGLGSSTDIAKKAVARGYPYIPQSSVAGWRMRNSIPNFWLPLLIQMGLEEKIISSIEDLRVPAKE